MLVFATAMSACGGADGDSPGRVVKAWNEAMTVSLDAAQAKRLSCAAYQPAVDSGINLLKSAGIKTDLSGLKYDDVSAAAGTAVVHVYGKMKMDMGGQLTETDIDQNVEVVKENGQWVACPKAQ